MSRPLTDRERAQVAESKVAELEEELRCWRERGGGDGDDADPLRISRVRDILRKFNPAVGGLAPARLLVDLLDNAGKPRSTSQLLDAISDPDTFDNTPSPEIIRVYLCRIRAAMKPAGLVGVIDTIWGHGASVSVENAREIRTRFLGEAA